MVRVGAGHLRVPGAVHPSRRSNMYGMVNQAIEAMVTERFGDNAWERVRDRAGVADPVFVTMKQYPDATTYALVGAISEETGTEVPVLLHAFGRYWVETTRGNSSRPSMPCMRASR
jgi:hypothetical protein